MPIYTYLWTGTLHYDQDKDFEYSLSQDLHNPLPFEGYFTALIRVKASIRGGKPDLTKAAVRVGIHYKVEKPVHPSLSVMVSYADKGGNGTSHKLFLENICSSRNHEAVTLLLPAFARSDPYAATDNFWLQVAVKTQDPPKTLNQPLRFDARALLQSPTPNDVELMFPLEEVFLWTNSTVLKSASPYFVTLLGAGFAEASRPSKRIKTDPETSATPSDHVYPEAIIDASETADDSDADEEMSDARHLALEDFKEPTAKKGLARQKVVITQARALTYLAVLQWIYSDEITFAPLRSLRNGLSVVSPPLAISPKSCYRLAHFLEITKLQRIALANFESQLTVVNVAEEMYSSTSIAYGTIRAVAIDFAAQNWAAVKGSAGMLKIWKEINDGMYEDAGRVTAELARRI